MEVKVNTSDLRAAVESALRGIPARSTLPILKSFLLTADNDILSVKGTDIESIGIISNVPAEVQEKGGICVDSKLFSEIVKKLPGDDTFISVDDEFNITIRSLLSEFTLKGKLQDEYPDVPHVEDGASIDIAQDLLRCMILKTSFCVSKEDTKPILKGVLFEINGKNISLVSLDGYRLSIANGEIKSATKDISFVVLGKTLNEIAKLLNGTKDITIYVSDNLAKFIINNTYIVARLLQGNYLNYKKVIQVDSPYTVLMDRNVLIGALERAQIVGINQSKSAIIKMQFSDKSVLVSSNSSIGKIEERVDFEGDGGNIFIAFNSFFLLEALKACNSDKVKLSLSSEVNPIFIYDGDNYMNMTLPIKINDKKEENVA